MKKTIELVTSLMLVSIMTTTFKFTTAKADTTQPIASVVTTSPSITSPTTDGSSGVASVATTLPKFTHPQLRMFYEYGGNPDLMADLMSYFHNGDYAKTNGGNY
ncbi:hypothetical protein [Lactiplantibacillus paraplantarum]|uniref:hypothetical protein n=1 Tax=Lactiplantibacillus paraplantarum TaxID=60520 RepID=UPI0023AA2E41|nr:hypothetical protein [Lactiplantibacillus paraplantarum]WEE34903.1 hypothetical protein PWO93_09200 [Lactiplantibacillus paraplantarum]